MPNGTSVYVNPYRNIKGLVPQRIDQGVDFTGQGEVVAIGDAHVLAATGSNSGWPGGGWIVYQLTSGPAAGKDVYVAEEVRPTVSAGQNVKAGQGIAHQFGFTETGWAANANMPVSQTAAAGSISGANLPGGGANPTRIGRNFDELLIKLGVPKAPNFNNPQGGLLPSGFPDWSKADLSGVSAAVGPSSGGGFSIGSDLFGGIAGDLFNPIANSLGVSSIGDFIERFLLIVVGAILVLIGIWKIGGPSIERGAGKVTEAAGMATGQPEVVGAGAVVEQRGERKREKQKEKLHPAPEPEPEPVEEEVPF